jgi:subtilase family serine protease
MPVVALDDAELESNESVLVTVTSDPAYIVSWTRTASIIIVSDEQFPDLTVSALTVPSAAGSSAPISLTDTTTNGGGGSAPASVTRYFLSANTVFEPGADTEVGSRNVPVLAPGASHSATTTFTLPAVATGTWYVLAIADAASAIPETSEANNSASRMVRIGPDLDVLSVALPSASGAGRSFSATDSVKNIGGGSAAASITRYYLSFNGTLESTDELLGTREVPALAAGETNVGSATLTVPGNATTGNWYVIVVADGGESVSETMEGNNTLVQTLRVGPDLDVTAMTLPASTGAGQTINANDTVRNQGGGLAAASTTHYVLSDNLTLDGADTPIGTRSLPALDAGATDSGSATLTIPPGIAAGTWYVFAVADRANEVAETSEINNTYVLSIKIGPDLDITALSVPAVAGVGDTINVTDTTKNAGGGAAPASMTRYVLSSDTVAGNSGDVPLGGREVPALAAGALHAGGAALTVPDNTPTGTYYVIAVADGDGTVGETYETNNIQAVGIRIGPDLIVSSMTGPSVIGAGQSMTVSETTRNQGAGNAAATLTRYFLSADSVFDPATDRELATRDVPELAAGASNVASTPLSIPAGTASGTWYVIAVADAAQALSETLETNNTRALSLRIGPDLVIGSLTGPSAAVAGQTITVSATVRNSGAGDAGASTARFYLSSDTTLDGADEPLGSRSVPALAAGASNSGSTVLTIPAGTAVGSYSVIAVADGDGEVVETSETNNRYTLSVKVGADLSVYSLSAPSFAAAGSSITVTDTTRNTTATPAPASATEYFLSANTTFDALDARLGSRDVPALGASASSTGSATVTIPANTLPGAYYLLARADSLSTVEEVSETNNVLARSISVGPDLVIAAFTVPGNATAGQSIGVTETTRNQGAAPAGATLTRYYLSTNTSLDAADEPLGSREVPALGAGASSLSGTVTLALPAGIAPGRWYVIAHTDALEATVEASETNNVFARTIWVNAP